MRRSLLWGICSLALAVVIGSASVATRAADDAKGTISGKVVDKDGNAVKGATVAALNPADMPAPGGGKGGKAGNQQADGKGGKGGRGGAMLDKAVAKATTGDDGTYKLTDVPAGKYVVIAMAPGAGRGRVAVEVTAGQDTKAEDIKLAMGGGPGGGRGGKRGGK